MVQRGWVLDGSVWSRMQKEFGPADWRKRPLSVDVKRHIPVTSGVYAICARGFVGPNPDGLLASLYNAVYVGKATNLQNRFDDHCRGYGDVRPARLVFRQLDFWFIETDRIELLEQLLMDALGPPANKVNSIGAKIGAPVSARRGKDS